MAIAQEVRLKEAYRIRKAYHNIPERERWIGFVKWLDHEVSDCEKEAGATGVAHVLKERTEDDPRIEGLKGNFDRWTTGRDTMSDKTVEKYVEGLSRIGAGERINAPDLPPEDCRWMSFSRGGNGWCACGSFGSEKDMRPYAAWEQHVTGNPKNPEECGEVR
jgi:hypothetical protein